MPPKGKHMSIHANDAEKIYLQSKKKRLTAVLSRIDSEMSDVLARGYKNIRCMYAESLYGGGHNNTDIFSDIVKYYNTLGWNVKNEGSGYIVITPMAKPPAPKLQLPPIRVEPSGTFMDLQMFQTGSVFVAPDLNAQLGRQSIKELTFTAIPAPKNRIITDGPTLLTMAKPFISLWNWFKEVMK